MRSLEPLLLVEDDLGDVMIIKKVLKELEIKNELIHSEQWRRSVGVSEKLPKKHFMLRFSEYS